MSAVIDYRRKIYATCDLPTLPIIAQRILTLSDDDETRTEALAKMMPVMDGFTAIRMIRQKFRQMKIVVTSGYTTPEKLPMLRHMGVEGFVQKPFEITGLADIVRDVLDGLTA
jgi:DNA-binding response OmpR family regulator